MGEHTRSGDIPNNQIAQSMPPFMEQKKPKAQGEKHAEKQQDGFDFRREVGEEQFPHNLLLCGVLV
jgi:hypothetical protein